MPRIPKDWLIADTHFNHRMLIENSFRPPNFQDLIIANWQRLVQPEDTVYHLGDVILSKPPALVEILAVLPGRKILIRGNHDRESEGYYLRAGFAAVAQGILIGGVWLTHAPQVTLPDGAVVNVHGHLHGNNNAHRSAPPPAPSAFQLPLPGGNVAAPVTKLLALEDTVPPYAPVEFNAFVGFSPLKRKILMPYETEEGAPDGPSA